MITPHSRLLSSLLMLLALVGCGESSSEPELTEAQRDAIRARVASEYAEEHFEEAQARIEVLLDEHASVEDLRWGATILLRRSVQDTKLDPQAMRDRAEQLMNRALPRAPRDPKLAFLAGVLAESALAFDTAVTEFEKVTVALPDEPFGWLKLGAAYENVDRLDEAEVALRLVRSLPIPKEEPARYSATHRLSRLLIFTGREAEGVVLADENDALAADFFAKRGTKFKPPTEIQLNFGPLASLEPPVSNTIRPGPWATAPELALEEVLQLELDHKAFGLSAADLDDDGLVDLLTHAVEGEGLDSRSSIAVTWQTSPGVFAAGSTQAELGELPSPPLRALDVDNDGRRELFDMQTSIDESGIQQRPALYRLGEDGEQLELMSPPAFSAQVPMNYALAVGDLDADGDIDLLGLAGDGTLQLLSGDGSGGFRDRSVETELDAWSPTRIQLEDLDGDNDLDIVLHQNGELFALDNERNLRFRRVESFTIQASPTQLRFADLDQDGRVEALYTTDDDRLQLARLTAEAAPQVSTVLRCSTAETHWELHDLDQDGVLDLLLSDAESLRWLRGPLIDRSGEASWSTLLEFEGEAPTQWLVADLLGSTQAKSVEHERSDRPARSFSSDGALELILRSGEAVRVLRATNVTPGVGVELAGITDNALGEGALVQWRAGEFTGSARTTGERLVLGLPPGLQLDLLRVVWPNGVTSHEFEIAPGSGLLIEQPNRVSGSCPFLYTWNGERYEFVSDVLGATPLGLPFAPGQMVPFDHEEAVLVTSEQLRPADGVLRLAITEELREVSYVDMARLRVIDHPASAELVPDEGFVLPPFPPQGEHLLAELIAPARARANLADAPSHRLSDFGASDRAPDTTPRVNRQALSAVADVTNELSAFDQRVARPFELLPLQFQGLTNPWSLDLEFGATPEQRAAIAAAPRLRLVLTGWLQWGDASVNLAAAEHPDYSYEIPRLWRPSADGGWEALPKPIGFPAGKTKTLVVDVTDFLDRADPRLRLTTTLELSWDRVALDLSAGATPTVTTTLDPTRARLEFRGLSQLIETGRVDQPERFDWDRLDATPMWDQHTGMFTRYGDVRPLLGEIDDEFVIMGAGDVVHLSFDASALPELPAGWTRSYLLDLDGWAKDGDPNTLGGQTVAPLPFHGMSSYPPAPGDVEPEREEWARRWNTRPARALRPRLSSAR